MNDKKLKEGLHNAFKNEQGQAPSKKTGAASEKHTQENEKKHSSVAECGCKYY